MTLIIGCITPEFAIIGGDTQLSSGDLNRGKIRRSIQLKVNRCSNDFMFGILGKWSWYYQEENGNVLRYNDDDNLLRYIREPKIDNKLDYLKKFIKSKDKLDASVIYVRAIDKGFELGSVSTKEEVGVIGKLGFEDLELIFNESFYKADKNFIQKLISRVKDENELTNSLTDALFLVNNVILEVIALGKDVHIPKKGEPYQEMTNSVGGYVTLQVMQHNNLHSHNNLFLHYQRDINTLLDRITYPFSETVLRNPKIIYIDNLSMLVRSYRSASNMHLRVALFEVIKKQIEYINVKDIIQPNLLNRIIEFINNKYEVKISPFELKEENTIVGLDDIEFEGNENRDIDFSYLKHYF